MRIIGITGTLGAGKGTIVDYLQKKYGFVHFSVRDFLIEEIEKRNLPVNRDSMTQVANELRTKYSPAYLVEQLYEKAKLTGKDSIIESIRNIGEVDALRQLDGFRLLAVDADPQLRYKRIQERKSPTDAISFETFLENEKREMTSTNATQQNISACMAAADYRLINDGSYESLYEQIEKALKTLYV